MARVLETAIFQKNRRERVMTPCLSPRAAGRGRRRGETAHALAVSDPSCACFDALAGSGDLCPQALFLPDLPRFGRRQQNRFSCSLCQISRQLHLSPIAAIPDDHKLGGSRQHRFILLQLQRSATGLAGLESRC